MWLEKSEQRLWSIFYTMYTAKNIGIYHELLSDFHLWTMLHTRYTVQKSWIYHEFNQTVVLHTLRACAKHNVIAFSSC